MPDYEKQAIRCPFCLEDLADKAVIAQVARDARAEAFQKAAGVAIGCLEEGWHNAAKNAAIVIEEAIREAGAEKGADVD